MSLLDPAFLFGFLPFVVFIFYVCGKIWGPRAACAVLALATLVFCIPYGLPFLVLLIASTLVNLWAFNALLAEKPKHVRYRFLWIALLFNFGLLFIFKYGNLFAGIPGSQKYLDILTAAVPVTLSFITFQRVVLILDVYQRQPEMLAIANKQPEGFFRFGAFNLLFSNLLIGPIAYVSEIGKQLERKDFGLLKLINFDVGLTLIAVGLVKKVLIADPIAIYAVDPIFYTAAIGHQLVPVEVAIAMLGYYVQLYFDFSGYTDIALGITRLFGIQLPINFNSPLRAVGIIDFYKRWHITLTRVVARLIFTPLAFIGTRYAATLRLKGFKAKAINTWVPLLLNFEIIGLWHGAKLTYVVFGALHGIWFIVETEIRKSKWFKRFTKHKPHWLKLKMGQALFLVPMVLSFALFRSGSLTEFSFVVSQLWGNWFDVITNPTNRVLATQIPIGYLAIAYAIVWFLPNVYEFMDRYQPGIYTFAVPSTTPQFFRFRWRPTWYWGLLAAAGLLMAISELNKPVPFIYGGF